MDFSMLMYTLFRQRFYYCILKFLDDLGYKLISVTFTLVLK